MHEYVRYSRYLDFYLAERKRFEQEQPDNTEEITEAQEQVSRIVGHLEGLRVRLGNDNWGTAIMMRSREVHLKLLKDKVSIVIPTRDEQGNIGPLLYRLKSYDLQIIVVDDSLDNLTANEARQVDQVTVFKRQFGRGLGSAIRDGAKLAKTDRVLVLDGDGQHPVDAIGPMMILSEDNDLVIGSRFAQGASVQGLSWSRKLLSETLNFAANGQAKTKCTDPMTGFFIAPKSEILKTKTNGFKILYEILLNEKLTIAEVPINFLPRQHGKSKASLKELKELWRTPRW